MHTSLLNMLHDPTDHDIATIADCIYIYLNGVTEKAVEQNRRFIGYPKSFTQVALKFFATMNNFHGAPPKNIGRSHHQRITNL